MEAATAPAPSKADRKLAIKLGSFILHVLNPAGDRAFRVIDESGLTFVQTKGLLTLATTEDAHLSVKALAEQLNVSVPSASRMVDGLVRAKLATREEDPDDRRVRQVSLNARGRRLAEEVISARIDGIERFAAGLDEVERAKLEDALEVLLEREEIAEIHDTHRRREGSR